MAIPRYFANDQPLTRREPRKQLEAALTRIVVNHPPDEIAPSGGIYVGPTSIAFLFFALQEYYTELVVENLSVGTWFAAYLKRAQEYMKSYGGPRPDKCGVVEDITSLLALGAASAKDRDMAKELCNFSAIVTEDGASNEWLYGRAGYLYLLRLAKASFVDDAEIQELIADTADMVIDVMLESTRPWKWHGKAYVGAVHGAMGIITQIVLTDPTYAPQLAPELAVLLTYQFDGGNWPASLPPGKDRLVQFCHGAPGIVASLVCIREHFPELHDRIDAAVARGRAAIKERGLLTKEPCLCHGISGNALALDDDDFEHFLTYTTRSEIKAMERDGMLEKSDEPASLWCGEAGRAWAWAVADQKLAKRFIGYNDL